MVVAHLPSVAEMKAGIAAMLDLPVSLLGLAMFRSWLSLLTHEELLEGLDGFAHDLALAAALLALAFLAGRISPLSARRWPMPLAALIACVVSGLALWANASGVCAAWAGPALGTLAACASAIFILGWCELYCLLDLNRIAMALALSFVLAVDINLALENSTAVFRHATLVMLPVASLLCYLRARYVVSTMSAPTTRRTNAASQRFPWPLLGLIALYYLASGICMGASDLPSLVFKNSANALAGLLLLVPVVLFSKSFDLRRLLSSPLAIFVCVLLLLPFAGFGGRSAAVAATTAIGAALFELAVFLLMCDIAQRRHCAPIFLSASKRLLRYSNPVVSTWENDTYGSKASACRRPCSSWCSSRSPEWRRLPTLGRATLRSRGAWAPWGRARSTPPMSAARGHAPHAPASQRKRA